MFQRINHNKKIIIGLFSILWMLLCPEILFSGDLCCISRVDGEAITKEEAEEIWQQLMYGNTDGAEKNISVTYKSKILEWLQEKYDFS